MVELQHLHPEPPELTQFCTLYPNAPVQAFDDLTFRAAKTAVKQALHREQDGLCVYCERKLKPDEGQVEHIKPKGGDHGHPHLCFVYTNYAHSCIHPKTCGQRKRHGLLPIEPGAHCNAEWLLSTDGFIEPLEGLDRQRRHAVQQTRDMLGLNKEAGLVEDRRQWLERAIEVATAFPADMAVFLQSAPYRHILATSV